MRRTITVFFALMLGLSTLFAQSKGGKTIYSQLGTTDMGNAYQSYEQPGMWGNKVLSADDFVVGAEGMELTGATFVTTYDGTEYTAEEVYVSIYSDSYGAPGTELHKFTFTTYGAEMLGYGKYLNTFMFDNNVVLTEGRYWIGMYGYGENTYASWYCIDQEEIIGEQAKMKMYYNMANMPIPNPIWDNNMFSYGFDNLAFSLLGLPDANDLALASIVSPVNGSLGSAEDVKIVVENPGLEAQTSFDVFYQVSATIDGELTELASVTESLTDQNLASGASMEYTFEAKADLSMVTTYSFAAKVKFAADEFLSNNAKYMEITNFGNVYAMGETDSVKLTDCQGVFVDNGGVNNGYGIASFDTITIYPSSNAKRVALTFDTFVVEEADIKDFVIFDGTSVEAPVLARLKGEYWWSESVAGNTYTARNAEGALTILVESKADEVNGEEGWIASLECIEPNAIEFNMLSMQIGQELEMIQANNLTHASAVVVNQGVDTVARNVYLIENGNVVAEKMSAILIPGEMDTVVFEGWAPSLVTDNATVAIKIEDDSDATNEDNIIETNIAVYKNGILLESFEKSEWPLGWYSVNGESWIDDNMYGVEHGEVVMKVGVSDTLIMPLMKVDPIVPEQLKFMVKIGSSYDWNTGTSTPYDFTVLASESLSGPWNVVDVLNWEEEVWHDTVVNIDAYKGKTVYFAVTHNDDYYDIQFDFVRGAGLAQRENDLFVQSLDVAKNKVKSGSFQEFHLNMYNMGTQAISGTDYSIQIIEEATDSVYFTFEGSNLMAGANKLLKRVGYFATADTIELHANIVYGKDQDVWNNVSKKVSMMVTDLYVTETYESSNGDLSSIINTTANSSISQVIYFPSEVGAYGNIKTLGFNYNYYAASTEDLNVQIYFATVSDSIIADTTLNPASPLWIEMGGDVSFTKVYDGVIALEESPGYYNMENYVSLQLDAPFAYDGKSNLLMMFVKNGIELERSLKIKASASKHFRYIYGSTPGEVDPADIKGLQAGASDYQMPLFELGVENTGAPQITSDPVVEAIEFSNYEYALVGEYTAGLNNFEFEIVEGPSWLSIENTADKAATLSGVAEAGIHNVRINLTDGLFTATQEFKIAVKAKPVFTTEAVLTTLINESYTYQVAVDYNSMDQVSFTIDSDILVITDNGDNTATVTGTPETAGDYNVVITATGEVVTTQEFVLSVSAMPAFTNDEVMVVKANEEFTVVIETEYAGVKDLVITGEVGEFTLTDNGNGTATITGTAAMGEYPITLEVTDGLYSNAADFTLIAGAVPVFTSTAVVDANQFKEYTYNVTVDYAGSDDVMIEALVLPEWLTFVDNGDGTATVSGTPEVMDIYNVVLRASGKYFDAIQSFNIDVAVGLSDAMLMDATVYPNPATEGFVNFAQNNAIDTEISIVDLTGKTIQVMNSSSQITVIDVTNVKSGVYVLVAKNANGVFNQQVVVE